ncbi:Os10g0489448 [Oryza sativa Japonica Group]|uniref:Os10g0489448 protein n=1 Tax=Oryza sativa subsp. japonica TaxID=39947 RepID=A0A0P0XW92_ORYSJ|nr:Os10g0489448 [Oryza sativa Japonica Group]
MTPTILAALSAACVKPAGKALPEKKLSRLSFSHSLAIMPRMCSSASLAASPGFSLRYNSLYDPSNPSCVLTLALPMSSQSLKIFAGQEMTGGMLSMSSAASCPSMNNKCKNISGTPEVITPFLR